MNPIGIQSVRFVGKKALIVLEKSRLNPISRIVIEPIVKLYKARKDPRLAAQIASELAVDGAVEYASWPIRFAKFWMAIGIAILAILSLICLWSALAFHWSIALFSLLFAAIIYGLIRIWRGLNSGRERITQLAKDRLATQVMNINIPSGAKDIS